MGFWRKKKEMKMEKKMEKEKENRKKGFLLENGSTFLKKLIADCNGMSNPIRMFSFNQINKATNHFDPKFRLRKIYDYRCHCFKGVIEDRSYMIKKFRIDDHAYNDIVLSARVSNHIGFLKLIGCCLEFLDPVLVFEDLEYKALNIRGSVGPEEAPVLPWNARLKIAKEVATAITYLHTAFPRIIIHRNINLSNVFLDKNGTAKLTNLSLAVTLPEGKTWIEDRVMGSFGFTDRSYLTTGIATEYLDVYSFGILMLILLLGTPLCSVRSDGPFYYNILDYVKDLRERGEPVEFGGDPNDMSPGQMKMFLDLALRCCEERNEDRPKMISVAKQIKLIEQASPPIIYTHI